MRNVGVLGSNRARQVAFLACSFSIGVFGAFNNFTLSLWLAGFTSTYFVLAMLGNTRSFEGALVSPAFGAWSDRVWAGWLGRRRPFILVGGLTAALLLALTPTIARLPVPEWLGWLPEDLFGLAPAVIAIFLFTFAFNAMDDLYKALLVDVTTPNQRNRLSGLSVVVNMAGNVAILVLGFVLWKDGIPDAAFMITAALLAAGVIVTVMGVREPPPDVWKRQRERQPTSGSKGGVRAFLSDYRGAAVFCLVVFAYWAGVNAVLPLISVYTRDILGADTGEAQLLPALLLLSTTILALPIARLGDRFGRRRVLGAGYVVMALAAVAGLVVTTKVEGAAVFVLAGVGNAAAMVLAVPLMAELVPSHRMGVATGLLAAAGSIAAPLSSIVAGALADVYDARAIFAVMAVMVTAALLLLPFAQNRSPRTQEISPAAVPITTEPVS